MGELAHLALGVLLGSFEEVLEALELVEDDEIRIEAVNADLGEHAAQLADDGEPSAVLVGVEPVRPRISATRSRDQPARVCGG